MKYFTIILLINIFLFQSIFCESQNISGLADLDKIFKDRGEVYFRFMNNPNLNIEEITRIISIDNKTEWNWIYAYANQTGFKEFLKLNINYEILQHPGTYINPKLADNINIKEIEDWDFYPTYEAYVNMMYQFQTDYPGLCEVFSIGQSVEGRELLFARISDNAGQDEGEAQFMYTATMHGDETAGYVLSLRLIHYLLSNYSSNAQINNLADNLDIWINPLANPDGLYTDDNSTIAGCTRNNANNVDLNRNYPDPQDGPHPDGNAWQPETLAFMQMAEDNHFILSCNWHSGAEVCNYPWDTWETLHADDDWWQYVCHEYADTAQFYSPEGYMTSYDDGITNGYAWYDISGGRQDYMNYFHQCREFTLEQSYIKVMPAAQLPEYWEYNYRSFLNYMEQALFGIRGTVTDSVSGEPIGATITIENHYSNNSYVTTNSSDGWYFRPIYEGSWDVTFFAPGYAGKTIENVEVFNRQITELNVELVYTGSGIVDMKNSTLFEISPNPANDILQIKYSGNNRLNCSVELNSIAGKCIFKKQYDFCPDKNSVIIDLHNNSKGLYLLKIMCDEYKLVKKVILK